MHDLTPITALGGSAARSDTIAGLTLTERPDVALASVAARLGQETATRAAVGTLIGTEAPGPGHLAGGEVRAFWIGPDQWMIEAPFATHENIATILRAVTGPAASVTEQTDAWTRFDLSGEDLVPVLELLSNLDHRRMASGHATRTTIHHLGCYLVRSAANTASIYGPRASAGSLHHAILGAMGAGL